MSRIALLSLFVLIWAVGCGSSPARNRGRTPVKDLDRRDPSEHGLASKDLTTATDAMVQSIAAHPDFRNAKHRTVVVMSRVRNRTSRPNKDFDIYLARIRVNLNRSGARRNIGFVAARSDVEAERAREGIGSSGGSEFEDPDAAPSGGGYRSKARYVLKGVFYDAPSGGTNTYLLTFQLVRFSDGEIVWEDSYEVKF